MNWDQIEGSWKQVKGKAKEQWGRLTDDEIDALNGFVVRRGAELDVATPVNQALLAHNVLLDAPSNVLDRTKEPSAAGGIEERLIDAERLHDIGVALEDRQNTFGHFMIAPHADRQKDRLGTQSVSLRDRHG